MSMRDYGSVSVWPRENERRRDGEIEKRKRVKQKGATRAKQVL